MCKNDTVEYKTLKGAPKLLVFLCRFNERLDRICVIFFSVYS